MESRFTSFVGGPTGPWKVVSIRAISGDGLPSAGHLDLREGLNEAEDAVWQLRGVTSNLRYTQETERKALAAVQPPLSRPEARCAALIPIRKTAAWWLLAQDERRAIIEEQSRHIAIGMAYLPAVARKLFHARDLGEPFDFLTWFEFAPDHAAGFDALLAALRASPEWDYVDREVEIRLERVR
ncbi:chlorite dismutase family protein [Ferrovibrio terrae]|uniref:Chlorite dismutase family protein n=1 Tax=Ferrovibrio terrae TaxID=2594003 RepID=A0A516GXF8_9PROT|nr:chlorite dismutase family protein [Ferrovibrio terrae]QDO96182.1 chlorite dismutase family protein [Ferrovibrio terrae]